MHGVTSPPAAATERPEIVSSWSRSRLNGVRREDAPRLDQGMVDLEGSLVRAAGPVLEQAKAELDGAPFVLLLADRTARIIDLWSPDPGFRDTLGGLGIAAGTRLSEEEIGTNAVGTPVETRQGLLVRGPEHFMEAFRTFTCYGHPIIHPITRRLEGVINICGTSDAGYGLFSPLARRLVQDIQERLQQDSTLAQRRLLAEFQLAARPRNRPVIAVGQGLVFATPTALDLLEPADHAAVRTYAEQARVERGTHELTLVSGRTVQLACAPIDGVDGVLIDIITAPETRRSRPAVRQDVRWPLLVVGETGTGRTTEARAATGPDAVEVDAAEIVRQGERPWATAVTGLLAQDGPAVIVENVQLLSEPLTTLLAQRLRDTRRHVVLTSTPGDHLDDAHAPLAALCDGRRELVPLRRRRHEVPRLAQRMLEDVTGHTRTRLTSDTLRVLAAQNWPGNLAELLRVVKAVAATRSAGDIIPADLPASHRDLPAPDSPFRQAEREVIVTALKAAKGNKLQAARALGVSRSTLYNRMRALHIH
ncbi:hypothetical protein LO762_08060 [Actinocorallia sp. API 0066]|uniref:sigma-54-dependent Fis family transcriptional regulator n=1 Tax=Actinocorallia sp. API 0066 TaxID=2896846 RepID=UPI001E54B0CA|nr:helix-turn-helix domain-containing protein [Actinocorallia sp. API 0066]MCD0449142.1 hypothetical protein [Actinocorallia sp. API 0066]